MCGCVCYEGHLDYSFSDSISFDISLELVRLSRILLFVVYIQTYRFSVSFSQKLIVVEESVADIQYFTYPAPSGIFMSVPGDMSFRLPSNSTKKFSKSHNIRFPSFSSSELNIDVVSFSSNNISPPNYDNHKIVCKRWWFN